MEPGRSVEWASDAPCSEILEPSRQQPLSMGRTSSETLLPSERACSCPGTGRRGGCMADSAADDNASPSRAHRRALEK